MNTPMLPMEEREVTAGPASVGLACSASSTHRANSTESQDAAALVTRENLNAVVVADGIGSFLGAGEAAHLAATLSRRLIERWDRPFDMDRLFKRVQRGIALGFRSWQKRLSPGERAVISRDRAFGTTLIVGVETPEALIVSYTGNGCAYHIRGDFAWFPVQAVLPWRYINLLSPHTSDENGREALYRYLSPTSTLAMAQPSIINLQKDQHCGDLVLIATDGLYSADQVQQGRDPEGGIWISMPKTMVALDAALRDLFLLPGELTPERVEAALAECLADLREARLLEDDTTLGLLITPAALAYRRLRRMEGNG